MIWFISDTHYSHRNIVRGISNWSDKSGCRNFDTLGDHDMWLVAMINSSVEPQDTLYHLGDWSFGGWGNIEEFREQLRCQTVHLIYGNHDHHQQKGNWDGTFASRQHYKELSVKGLDIVLCHYPLESWNNMERGSVHLHGHVHGQGRQMGGRYDVGVDATGLISLDAVAELPRASIQRHKTIEGGNKFGI